VASQTLRHNKFDHLYSTLEDFARTDPGRRRLVVIGCTGAGKSTLLNVLSGWRFVQTKENSHDA
jgi:GTPase SAR1 family protein